MLIVSSTIASYKATGDPGYSMSWLANAEEVKASVEDEVLYYAAIEVDGRGLAPFERFIARLEEVGGIYQVFSFDDGSAGMTTGNRLVRIATGQNFGSHYAMERRDCTHVLFCATDVVMPDDVLPRLLELDHPLTGLNIPTYCLTGPLVAPHDLSGHPTGILPPGSEVRVHMQSAALLLAERQVFTRLRWRVDFDAGMTDDPCYHADALELGWTTWVRHDVQAGHYPECLGPMESRHSIEERAYQR